MEVDRSVIVMISIVIGFAILFKRSSLAMILIAVLFLCSVLEGIHIGVADNKADAWECLWDISLDRIYTATAIGVTLRKFLRVRRPSLATIGYLFAFLMSNPIGVAIGIHMDATAERIVDDAILAALVGYSFGTLIYGFVCDTICDLISLGYQLQRPSYNGPFKFASGLLGVGAAAAFIYRVRYYQ